MRDEAGTTRARCARGSNGTCETGGRAMATTVEGPVCRLDFPAHRADDLPAYLVIVIVGHVLVPLILWIEVDYAPSLAFQLGVYLPITALASIALLQPGREVRLRYACLVTCRDVVKDAAGRVVELRC